MTALPDLTVVQVTVGDPLVRPLLAELAQEYERRYGPAAHGGLERYPAWEFEPPYGALLLLLEGGAPRLCGLTVGTGAGTTFEATLTAHQGDRAKAGRKPYQVKVVSDQAAILTGLQQGRFDVLMSTINGLRYQAAQPAAGITFLGEFHRLDVGFAFRKGSPLTKAFQAVRR